MDLRHIANDTVLMVIVCIAAMFFHPVAYGPYSAVHGPTTTLGAARRVWVILTGMAIAAFAYAASIALVLSARASLQVPMGVAVRGTASAPPPLRC